ncbi:MAG: hypothetical protein AM326_09985 [Candidatus Thorarchaeota archaeon SMTZ-45]|nr:MAG: hypothetical protein AM325_10710 [Candidatus Thorarchaeota archaeon SMTZ1-45]KXH74292.1 MAG: hypothetical protein AM326_09985 [Candidatus Thorarchaeota archaeon SMTZ-45]
MVSSDKRDVWRESLGAMKASLEKSYEFKTIVQEEEQLIQGLRDISKNYVVFSGYRRNDGKRRMNDIKSMIDSAIEEIDCCDSKEASSIYLQTLKAITMQTRWASILEDLSKYYHNFG